VKAVKLNPRVKPLLQTPHNARAQKRFGPMRQHGRNPRQPN
jgi:hypothetical protein